MPQTNSDWEDLTPQAVKAKGTPAVNKGGDEWEDISAPVSTGNGATPEAPASALSRFGSGVAAGAKAMIPQGMPSATDIALSGLGPLAGMARSAYSGYKDARADNQPVYSSLASGIGSAIGLDPQGIRDRAAKGDIAGIAGEAVPSIAATLIGGEHERIGSAIDAGKDTLGATLRTPEGKLKPVVRGAARVVGGVAGSTMGTGGTIIGGLAAPSIADAVIPDHPNPTGWNAKLPVRMPRTASLSSGLGRAPMDVSVIPEPREPLPGDKEGVMYSVKRNTILPESAQRGAPGAGDVLKNIGRPVIYLPREGVGYEGPRSSGPGSSTLSTHIPDPSTVANPKVQP